MQAVFNFLKSLAWQNNLVNHITQLVSSSSLPCIPVVPQVLAVSLFSSQHTLTSHTACLEQHELLLVAMPWHCYWEYHVLITKVHQWNATLGVVV